MDKRLDLLNREEFVENVIKIVNQLSDIKRGCCFAIEGGWGVGKTFVIEKIEDRLKVFLSEETNSDRYFVFHYNCWQHDYYEEPAVAIISAMLASIREDEVLVNGEAERIIKAGYEFVGEELKKIAGLYIENKIGINLISLAEERTIVLFVDELDRCIPQYAIKVLERLHHIFYGLDNVVVIMAIDRKQLEHSVEEMFGVRKDESSIDIEKYLKKFIDFSVVLDNGILNESYREKYKVYFDKFMVVQEVDKEDITNILSKLFPTIGIREQEKLMEKANMVHSLVCNETMDISVLVFEVLYEVLKIWKFRDLQYVATINDGRYTIIEERIGKYKMDILKSFGEKAYSNVSAAYGQEKILKVANSNMYGRVFWYFANIFYHQKVPYAGIFDVEEQMRRELKTAKKYCKFCEMVK